MNWHSMYIKHTTLIAIYFTPYQYMLVISNNKFKITIILYSYTYFVYK